VNKNDTFTNFPSIKDPHPSATPTRGGGDEFSSSNAGIVGLPPAPGGDNDELQKYEKMLKAELLLLARPTSPKNHLTNLFNNLFKPDQQFRDRQKADNFILSKNQAKTKYQKYSDFKRKGTKNKRTLMSDLV
jgi:hypothetical protein